MEEASGVKGALVTGAAGGIGAATAARLTEAGYEVCVTDLDLGACETVASRIGGKAWARSLDVTQEDQCRAAASEVANRTGSLDLWVNNAGIVVTGVSFEQSIEIHRRMLEVNTVGTINGTNAAITEMRGQEKGHVINVVSLAGLIAAPGEVGYSASKHAAIAYSLGTLYDLRRTGVGGIDVSAVCPDGVWSPMISDKLHDPDATASFSGKMLLPDDVARVIVKVARKPRPVTAIPRWRGGMLRLLDAFPGLLPHLIPALLKDATRKQAKLASRVDAGTFPPS